VAKAARRIVCIPDCTPEQVIENCDLSMETDQKKVVVQEREKAPRQRGYIAIANSSSKTRSKGADSYGQ